MSTGSPFCVCGARAQGGTSGRLAGGDLDYILEVFFLVSHGALKSSTCRTVLFSRRQLQHKTVSRHEKLRLPIFGFRASPDAAVVHNVGKLIIVGSGKATRIEPPKIPPFGFKAAVAPPVFAR